MLDDQEGIHLAWGAADSREALLKVKDEQPDVLLMDISIGKESGIDLTAEILRHYPEIGIIGLSMHKEDNYIVKMLEVGAKGYLLKDAGADEMLRAITTVYGGETYYSPHVMTVLVRHVTTASTTRASSEPKALTTREVEVLKLIAEEYSNPEIASQLYISIRTVDTHRRNLLDKLQVKNTAGLVRYAVKHGIVQ